LVDNVYEGVMKSDSTSRKRAVGYVSMLVAFAMGAACSNLLSKVVAYRTCWLVSVALFIVFILKRMLTCDREES